MESTIDVLKAQISLLAMLIERECKCDRAKCAEHFAYMRQLKYDYECKLEDHEAETNAGD